jgi:hypothetical protein
MGRRGIAHDIGPAQGIATLGIEFRQRVGHAKGGV